MIRSKPWIVLFLSLCCALVVGVSVKTFFSPEKIKTEIENQLNKTELDVSIGFNSARLQLSEGLRPRFGLLLNSVVIVQKKICGDRFFAKELYLPISLIDLLQGRFKFTAISARKSWLQSSLKKCRESRIQGEKSVSVMPKAPKKELKNRYLRAVDKIDSFFKESWEVNHKKASTFLEGIEFINFKWMDEYGREQIIVDHSTFKLKRGDKLSVKARVRAGSRAESFKNLKNLIIEADISSGRVYVDIKAQSFEGRTYLKLDLKPRDNMALETSLKFKNFPLRAVSEALQSKKSKKKIIPQPSWLNCSVSFSGLSKQLLNKELKSSECQIIGDLGTWTAEPFSLIFKEDRLSLKTLNLKIEELPLLGVVKSLQWNKANSLFRKYGKLSGEISKNSRGVWSFGGFVRDLSLAFSSRGQRASQKIDIVPVDFKYTNEEIFLNIGQIVLDGAEYEGEVSANYNLDTKIGMAELDIKKFGLSQKIQKLLVGGTLEPVSFKGDILFNNKKLSAEVSLTAREINGDKVQAQNFKIQGALVDKVFLGDFHANEIKVSPKSSYHEPLYKLSMDSSFKEKDINFNEFSSNFKIFSNRGEWFDARAQKPLMQFESYGSWQKAKMKGAVLVQSEVLPELNWSLSGSFFEPSLSPSPATLKWMETALENEAELESQAGSQIIKFFKQFF